MEARYITSAAHVKQFPEETLPEVAFIGRSNCGKSSLLNAIVNRRNLARHSSTPGRTQMVNFFSWGQDTILVDLPGYGFSKASGDVVKLWQTLISRYLSRDIIKVFLFLVDARRSLDATDLALLRDLAEVKPIMLVLTKSDKLKTNALQKSKATFKSILKAENIDVIDIRPVSSLKKTGIEDLREFISTT